MLEHPGFIFSGGDGQIRSFQAVPQPCRRMHMQRDARPRLEQRSRQRTRVDFPAADEPVQIDVVNVDHRGEAAIIIAASRLDLR